MEIARTLDMLIFATEHNADAVGMVFDDIKEDTHGDFADIQDDFGDDADVREAKMEVNADAGDMPECMYKNAGDFM